MGQNIDAQSLSSTVIGNAGMRFENEDFGTLNFTLGEVAISYFEVADGSTLGEGFHRLYYDLIVSTREILPADWSIEVFPNPTIGYLVLKTDGHEIKVAELYNQLGQRLMEHTISDVKTEFDFGELPVGAYYLKVLDEQGRSRTFKVMKVGR